jgi:hypothetical protein
MKRHLNYLKYLLRHKWFVFVACRACGVPFWQAILHDWHKFLPSEWGPYLRTFYAPDGSTQYKESPEFAASWNLHQKRARHHWQFWVMYWDRGDADALPMPERYVREMVADWWGAGRAITGKWDALVWYFNNTSKMFMHQETRELVKNILLESADKLHADDFYPFKHGWIHCLDGVCGPCLILRRDSQNGRLRVRMLVENRQECWVDDDEIEL